jgi:hypothetical protein
MALLSMFSRSVPAMFDVGGAGRFPAKILVITSANDSNDCR